MRETSWKKKPLLGTQLVLPLLLVLGRSLAEDPTIQVGDKPWEKGIAWVGIIFLISLSGLFSGLTLGLMTLDMHGLEMVMAGKNQRMAECAKRIAPVRKNGNLLLCTLLFGNVAVISMTSIVMSDLTSGLVGFLSSTIAIVIFGEILPQAACSRYALEIGARTIPIVKLIIILLYPAAKPVAVFLDCTLGEELGTIHTREELMKMMEIHVRHGSVDEEVGRTLHGALKYQDISLEEVMTPVKEAFMLQVDEKLDMDLMARIFREGYSRIPIYDQSVDDIVGLMLVKDLVFVDPNDRLPVRSFLRRFARHVQVYDKSTKMRVVLRGFKTGRSHLAIVASVNPDQTYKTLGIVTMEDVLEVILGLDIMDERDYDRQRTILQVGEDRDMDRSLFDGKTLRLFDTAAPPDSLTAAEVTTVVASLLDDAPSVTQLVQGPNTAREGFLRLVVENSQVFHLRKSRSGDHNEALYSKGVSTSLCTVILDGHFRDEAGNEYGPSSVLCPSALVTPGGSPFLPDCSVYLVSDTAKCLQINRPTFEAILRVYDGSNLAKTRAEVGAMLQQNKPVGPRMLRRDSSRRALSFTQSVTVTGPSSPHHHQGKASLLQQSLKSMGSFAKGQQEQPPLKLVTIVSSPEWGEGTLPPTPEKSLDIKTDN